MTERVHADPLSSQELADKIISFTSQAVAESTIIDVYGDTPECEWCVQLRQDVRAEDLVNEYFRSRGQSFVLKYVEHYIDVLFNFTDGLKYQIIIHVG